MESVELPDSLAYIGEFGLAFSGEWVLKNKKLPKNLVSIGAYAFTGARIYNMELPDCLEKIGTHAFADCSAIEEQVVCIPESVVYLGREPFYECPRIKRIKVPKCWKGVFLYEGGGKVAYY